MSVFWIPVVAVGGGIFMVIVIALAGARTREREAELKANVQMKLIERFGTADEFVQFVQSNEGKQFLGNAPQVAKRGVVAGIRWGIIMMSIGAAFVVLGGIEDRDWFIPAFILLGLGIGFFVSAFVSMRIARQLDEHDKNP